MKELIGFLDESLFNDVEEEKFKSDYLIEGEDLFSFTS
jgi:hypothetical protein